MDQAAESGWQRRDFLGAAALLALALGIPATAVRLSELDGENEPDETMRALMREVSQLVIPRTATAGAGELGVGDFVLLALAHGLDGSRDPLTGAARETYARFRRSDGSLNQARWLEHELGRRSPGGFLGDPRRAGVLAALDAEAYAEGANDHPWRLVKTLILTGYYTSEIGGSQELRYELVPGRWDPDLPANGSTIAFSSDWTAVDFG